MQIILPPPIVYSHSVHQNNPNEGKEVLAFWIALHILPILWVIITYIIAKIQKDKYYCSFQEEYMAWSILGFLIVLDILFLISVFIHSFL